MPRGDEKVPLEPPPYRGVEKDDSAVGAPHGASAASHRRKGAATRGAPAPDPPQGRGRTRQEEGPNIRQGVWSRRDPPGRDGKETQDAIVQVHLLTVGMTAAARWSEIKEKGDRQSRGMTSPARVCGGHEASPIAN